LKLLEDLWNSPAGAQAEAFPRADLPPAARLYLEHAMAIGTPPSYAVRLRMHGEIKLRRWLPFTAEQVIHRTRGFVWRATVRMSGFAIRGYDRLVDGEAEMRWRLLGLVPVMTASGPDISRSAAGRFGAEAAWLPSILSGDDVSWTAEGPLCAVAHCRPFGEAARLTIAIAETGRVLSIKLSRWGNPEGAAFHYVDFGAVTADERTFSGFTHSDSGGVVFRDGALRARR
jgi:hypothetical protein